MSYLKFSGGEVHNNMLPWHPRSQGGAAVDFARVVPHPVTTKPINPASTSALIGVSPGPDHSAARARNARALSILLGIVFAVTPAVAHPGRTDKSGCHVVRKTFTDKAGLTYHAGQSHCHRPLDRLRLDDRERLPEESSSGGTPGSATPSAPATPRR